MGPTIRTASSTSDIEAIRVLFREYAASLGFDLCFQDFERELAELPGPYASPSGRLLLAMAEVPAGCVALKPLGDGVCEMKRLYVRKSHRKNRLGRTLVEHIIKEARGLGYRAIRLDTVPGVMGRAVALYRSLGFREIPPYCHNPVQGALFLELPLLTDNEAQRQLILDQFTKQAVPFAAMPAHSNEASVRLVIDLARIGPADTLLDVACGPGLLACRLAEVARHVTGVDLTPAMIEQAQAKQRSSGLANLSWVVGEAAPLAFPDAAFAVAVTRFSFHHFLEPKRVLAEMVRVCAPGGRVVVIDVFTSSAEQAEAYNRVEKPRDPSHVRALSLEGLTDLFQDAGLRDLKTAFFRLEVALEALLAASFPNPGDGDRVRQTFADDIGVDRLGVGAHRRDGDIYFSFPIVVIAGRTKSAGS
jgi:SAM-dependent methyltransferase/GNAT superfamily N-acetyltransferase